MHVDRRRLLALLAAGVGTPALAASSTKNGAAMSPVTAYAFSFAGLQGGSIRLADYAGKPIMVVNTASLCGYTPQYTGLEQLFERFHDRGFMIVGVPSNDFGGQEPGGAAEISATANKEYGVTFPLAAKVDVKGPNSPSILQMGGRTAAARNAAMEFPQIPGRQRRLDRGGISHRNQADGHAHHRSGRPATGAAGIIGDTTSALILSRTAAPRFVRAIVRRPSFSVRTRPSTIASSHTEMCGQLCQASTAWSRVRGRSATQVRNCSMIRLAGWDIVGSLAAAL